MNEPRSNWFAWSLYFLIGAFCGAIIGVVVCSAHGNISGGSNIIAVLYHLLGSPDLRIFSSGTAALGGGFVSYFGDRVFYGPSTLAWSNKPGHGSVTRAMSAVMCALGVMVMFFAIVFT